MDVQSSYHHLECSHHFQYLPHAVFRLPSTYAVRSLFRYLLYWTRNIWIPVFAHFVNNAIAVISMSDAKLKDNEFITGDISTQNLLPYTIVAIVALFFFCPLLSEIENYQIV